MENVLPKLLYNGESPEETTLKRHPNPMKAAQ